MIGRAEQGLARTGFAFVAMAGLLSGIIWRCWRPASVTSINHDLASVLRERRIVVEELTAFHERVLEGLAWQELTSVELRFPKRDRMVRRLIAGGVRECDGRAYRDSEVMRGHCVFGNEVLGCDGR